MAHELFNENVENWIFDNSNEFMVSERLLPEFTDMVIQAQWRKVTDGLPPVASNCGTKSILVDIMTAVGRFVDVFYCHATNIWIDENTGDAIPHAASHWMQQPVLPTMLQGA